MLNNKTIAVVIPAYNEEKNIGSVISDIPDFVDNIVVVDDGSEDNTPKIVSNNGADLVRHDTNKGVGAAFKSGLNYVLTLNTDILVNIDADGQFNPADIEKLVDPIITNKADFVTASRFKDENYYPDMPKIKFLGNKFMSWFISKLTDNKFYDVSCGFRAYSREAMLKLNLFGDFTYTQETFIDLSMKKINIKEIPVHVRGERENGKSRVASNLFNYGYRTLKIIVKTLRDYNPLKLFGFLSLVFFVLGIATGVFLIQHYIASGSFSPHKWAGFLSGFLVIISFILVFIGFVMDSFARMRNNQENILYYLKNNME